MSLKLSVTPRDKSPLSPNDEARQLCQRFRKENYAMDEVAQTVCDSGLSEGYRVFLQKYQDYPIPVPRRSWVDAPESEEYQERKGLFEKRFLDMLRKARDAPVKAARAMAFLDLKVGEGAKHGIKRRS